MKGFKKIIAIFSLVALMTSVMAGCSKETKVENKETNTLSMWATMDSNTSVSCASYNDMLLFEELEKRTGIHIDFVHPVQGSTGSEAFVSMLLGDEIPDIIEYNWVNYTGGPQQAIDDGVIIALNEYLEEHAPNYYDYLEGEKGKANNYLYKLQSATDAGNYYGFNVLSIGNTRCFVGLSVRGDKLREWGLDVPQTIDDWTNVFAKAKADGFAKPFTAMNDPVVFNGGGYIFNTAFNVGKNFYLEDGEVVFAPFQKGFKEYVAQMAEWTKLGYIDTGFVTNDWAALDGNLANNISVAAYHYISDIGNITTAAREKNPNFELIACPFPTAKKGEISEFQGISAEAQSTAYAISAECESPITAIEWCDYIYSEEGNILHAFGIEGDTYTIEEVDGEKHYKYTEKITTPENSGVTSIAQAIYKYVFPANHPGLAQHPDYLSSYYPLEIQQDAMEVWNKGVAKAREHILPALAYTEEENREKTDILEVAESELEVALSDIILGRKSIDTYDDAIKKAKENGYERVIEITQTAYDRYMNKFDNYNK